MQDDGAIEAIPRCDLLPQYHAYKEEIDRAVKRVFESGRYVLAEEGISFEKEFADYIGTDYAAGVASATDGLILTLKAYGLNPGDEVITTAFTALPTVSAIIGSGATPVFVDIVPDTFLMDLEKVKEKISTKTKAVVPVHIFGNVLNVPQLRRIVGGEIAIIEDAAQAHGSKKGETMAGALGDAGVFSFYPTKNLGGYGDGGMVLSNDSTLVKKIKLLRNYGISNNGQVSVHGLNSRLDELQAGILRVKLKYLDDMNKRRGAIAARYKKKLRTDLAAPQIIPTDVYSNYHVFTIRFKKNRARFLEVLNSAGIRANIYFPVPLHLQKANEYLGYHAGDFPEAERLCAETVALPLYPELEQDKVDRIIDVVNSFSL